MLQMSQIFLLAPSPSHTHSQPDDIDTTICRSSLFALHNDPTSIGFNPSMIFFYFSKFKRIVFTWMTFHWVSLIPYQTASTQRGSCAHAWIQLRSIGSKERLFRKDLHWTDRCKVCIFIFGATFFRIFKISKFSSFRKKSAIFCKRFSIKILP